MTAQENQASARKYGFTTLIYKKFLGSSKSLFTLVVQKMGARRFYNITARLRRRELALELRAKFGSKVLSGPFKDMLFPNITSWGDGDDCAKILGIYESNLYECLQRAVARAPVAVVNVGCAEGYYAVGLARLLPDAQVFAYDIDAKAGAVCTQAAKDNGVAGRVTVGGLCTTETLSEIIGRFSRTLIVMDCEGAERELLDPDKVRGLPYCDIIVEMHDVYIPGITDMLEKRLSPTHDVQRIAQGGRNPNELHEMARFSEQDRWLMASENRGAIMTWLACWARSETQ